MQERISRFEYEVKRYSAENLPEVFSKVIDGESCFKGVQIEKLFGLDISKKKPKKRMRPKDTADVLSLTLKPKRIDTQDLVQDDSGDVVHGQILQPLINVFACPTNLKEMIEFGISNPMYSTSILFELMEQLYVNDNYNLLVLVDEYNELFQPSEYPSIKYVNYRETKGYIPPYDISLGRLFMKFDGHTIKNGAKIVAVSEKNTCYSINKWKGDPLNQGKQFSLEIQNLALDDLRNLINYYNYCGLNEQTYIEADIAAIYMQSQGNFGLALESISFSPEKTY